MTNWQTTTVNLLSRLTIKQLVRREVSVQSLRGSAAAIERLFAARPAGCEIAHDHPLPHCDAEWVRPQGIRTDRVVLHFPGGAYVLRLPNLERSLLASICRAAHARGRLVFYRLAPEHPFPAGHGDCLAAYRQLLDQGVDADRIVLSGISAGGGMALGVVLAIRDRNWPLPAAVVAMSPLTDLAAIRIGSRVDNERRDPVLSHDRGLQMREMYVGGDRRLLTHPYVSPVYGEFRDVPPVLFQVGSTEILLDDSRRCAERLRGCRAEAEVEVWDRMPHGWQAFAFLPEAQQAIERSADFVRMHVP